MTEDKELILSREGLKKMEEELEMLKTVKRREVADRIKTAREFGDISENSEYEDAKNEQAMIEGTIMSMEKKLRNVKILEDAAVNKDIVGVGSTVTIQNTATKDKSVYTIVGSVEADPFKNKISNESPVGQGLLGHAKGDKVEITIPAGTVVFEILDITR